MRALTVQQMTPLTGLTASLQWHPTSINLTGCAPCPAHKEKARPKTRPIYCCQPSRWVVLPAPSMRMNFFLWTPCLSDDSFQAIFSSLLTTILVSAQFPWASLWPPGTHLPCLPIHELVVVHELGFPLTQRLASLSLSSTSSWTLSLADLPVSNGLSWRGNFLITGKIFCVSILDTASLRAVSLAWTSLKWFQDVLSWLSSMTEIHLAGFLAARPCSSSLHKPFQNASSWHLPWLPP